jgi:hypothetical protein
MHRVQPSTGRGYLLVAHTAYPPSRGSKDRGFSTCFLDLASHILIAIEQSDLLAYVDLAPGSFLGRASNSPRAPLIHTQLLAFHPNWCIFDLYLRLGEVTPRVHIQISQCPITSHLAA